MHIGIIGGIGPAATELYYRQLLATHARERRRLELTMVHADLAELLRNLSADARASQADLFGSLAGRLQAAGADMVAITSMAGHFCIREFEAVSPLPVVSAIDAVQSELTRQRVKCVGVLGTRAAMTSQLFGGLEGFVVMVPAADDVEQIDREYLAMARAGRVSEEQRELFFDAGRQLHRHGAEVVLLAGTDLFLAFDGRDYEVRTVDCATVHVAAITRFAPAGAPE